jgi:hypothetical protein
LGFLQLGDAFYETGHLDEAIPIFEALVEETEGLLRRVEKEHSRYMLLGKSKSADEYRSLARSVLLNHLDEAERRLLNYYSAIDAREDKERVLGRLYQRAVELHGAAHERTLDYALRIADCLVNNHKCTEARSFLQEPIAAASRALGPDSVLLLKLRMVHACSVERDPDASLEMLIEITPLVEEGLRTAQRLLGDENPIVVQGRDFLAEHLGNVAKAKARRVLERFISRFKARRRA